MICWSIALPVWLIEMRKPPDATSGTLSATVAETARRSRRPAA